MRNGIPILTETSTIKFYQAYQKPEELLEDFVDRVITQATPAFVDLLEEHLETGANDKFCQGCSNKGAVKSACFERPSTMKETLNLVIKHQ